MDLLKKKNATNKAKTHTQNKQKTSIKRFSQRKKATRTVRFNKKNTIRRASSVYHKGKGIWGHIKGIFISEEGRQPDKVLFLVFGFLIISGILTVLDTSLVFAKREFSNPYHFLILQTLWVFIGSIAFYLAYRINYKVIRKFILLFYILTILLLIMTLFTSEINGARSWISLGGVFTVQPSELAKLTFVLYISGNLANIKKVHTTKEFLTEDFIPFAGLLLLIVFLVLLGKDLGTSIIIVSVALFIYLYKASTKREYWALTAMFGVCILGAFLMTFVLGEKYRGDRIEVYKQALFQGSIYDEQGSGYQMKQILLALGSGGVTGVGLADSLQKYDLVETTPSTDSVIAIIAEELGLIGAIAVLGVFLVYIYRGLRIASTIHERYGQIVVIGLVSWIAMQVFLHVASNVVVTPLTGVPLPFLSYGGSSTISCMIATGIILNISKNADIKNIKKR